jgi:hypothetical protein
VDSFRLDSASRKARVLRSTFISSSAADADEKGRVREKSAAKYSGDLFIVVS